jgi:hypothetical protein
MNYGRKKFYNIGSEPKIYQLLPAFFSLGSGGLGWTRTHNLGMVRLVFYHRATASDILFGVIT